MSLRLNVLGGLSLSRQGQSLGPAAGQRKPLALLAVIERAGPAGISREKLMELLAPESDEERARGVLKQLLYAVRKDIEPSIAIGVTTLGLNAEVVECDLRLFERHCAAGAWREAAELYHGPYLDGVFLTGSPAFDEWVEAQRRAVAGLYRHALLTLAQSGEATAPGSGAEWWERLCALDPLDPALVAAWMRSLAAGGKRGTALQVARDHERRVREDLGLAVDLAVTEAREEVERTGLTTPPPSLGAALEPVPRTRTRIRSIRWPAAALCAAALLLILPGILSSLRHDNRGLSPLATVAPFTNATRGDSLANLGSVIADRVASDLARNEIALILGSAEGAPSGPPNLVLTGSYRTAGDTLVVQAEVREFSTQHPIFEFSFVAQGVPVADALLDSVARSFTHGMQRQIALFRDEWGIDSAAHDRRAVVRFMGVYLQTLKNMSNCKEGLNLLDSAFAADPTLIQPLIMHMQIAPGCVSPNGEWMDTLRYERVRQRLREAQAGQDRFGAAFIDFVLHPDTTIRLHAGRTMITEAPRSEMIRGLLIRTLADHNQYAEIIRVFESFGSHRHVTAPFLTGMEQYGEALHLAGRYEDELRLAEARLAVVDTTQSRWEFLDASALRFRALAALHRPVDLGEARRVLCCSLDRRGNLLLTFFDELATHGRAVTVDSIVSGQSCLNLENPLSPARFRKWLKQVHESPDTYRFQRRWNAQQLLYSVERAMHFGCVDDATNGFVDVMRPIPDSVYYMAVWGEFAASQGRQAQADSALTYLRSVSETLKGGARKHEMLAQPWFPPYRIAMILGRLGRREQAFEQLADLLKDGTPIAMELHTDPLWRSYAADPMFRAVIGR